MKRAFTLIEIMVSIAIFSLLLLAQIPAWKSFSRLRREGDFRTAARNAQHQLAYLQKIPFEALPPQILQADAQGWVSLGQPDIDSASLKVRLLKGDGSRLTPLDWEPATGKFRLDARLRGQPLLVDYDFYLSDHDETHIVPGDGRVSLENIPALRVENCWLARGDELSPLKSWRLSQDGSYLEVGPEAQGGVVVVDYRGQRQSNRVGGEFLDETLQPLDGPSPLKLLHIREQYALTESMQVDCLRVQR